MLNWNCTYVLLLETNRQKSQFDRTLHLMNSLVRILSYFPAFSGFDPVLNNFVEIGETFPDQDQNSLDLHRWLQSRYSSIPYRFGISTLLKRPRARSVISSETQNWLNWSFPVIECPNIKTRTGSVIETFSSGIYLRILHPSYCLSISPLKILALFLRYERNNWKVKKVIERECQE